MSINSFVDTAQEGPVSLDMVVDAEARPVSLDMVASSKTMNLKDTIPGFGFGGEDSEMEAVAEAEVSNSVHLLYVSVGFTY